MVLAFVLGVRTYRVEGYLGRRVGTGIGAIVGWTCFFALCWLSVASGWANRTSYFARRCSRTSRQPAPVPFPPASLVATVLVVYALYATRADFGRRRTLTLVAAGLAVLAGLGLVAADPDPVGIVGALISTAAGAVGGWVSGAGYARAGGDDMIPPGATIRPREPRAKCGQGPG